MGRRFAELAFTPAVKEQQTAHGSREQYRRVEQFAEMGDSLGDFERAFIKRRDGFYIATVSETDWPYIQFRGGPPGFLHVLDNKTLGFADLSGNRQYITTGNLAHNDRVALFLMDYPRQQRLKIFGRAEIHEGTPEARAMQESLRAEPRDRQERAFVIHVEAVDWNCPQHITQRFTIPEIQALHEHDPDLFAQILKKQDPASKQPPKPPQPL